MGENAEPKARERLAAVKEKLQAMVSAADRMLESNQLGTRHNADKLRSQLREQCDLLEAAKNLAAAARERFERVKLRFSQRLSGFERAGVTEVGESVARTGKLDENYARYLLKIGFGEEFATRSLAGGAKDEARGLQKLLGK